MFALQMEDTTALHRRFIEFLLSLTPEQHHVLATAMRGEMEIKNLFLLVQIQNSLNHIAHV